MEYQFRLSRLDGAVHLDRFEYFPDDERALAVAFTVLAPANGLLAMEVWRNDECIYDSRSASPPRESNVVPFPRPRRPAPPLLERDLRDFHVR